MNHLAPALTRISPQLLEAARQAELPPHARLGLPRGTQLPPGPGKGRYRLSRDLRRCLECGNVVDPRSRACKGCGGVPSRRP